MAGLVPAIPSLAICARNKKDVDARDKRGHDERSTILEQMLAPSGWITTLIRQLFERT